MGKQFMKFGAVGIATVALSFGVGFAASQIIGDETEVKMVQEAQAILAGQKLTQGESTNDGNTDLSTESEDVTDTSTDTIPGESEDEADSETEAGNDAEQSTDGKEAEIPFDWSFDDWTYNGVHISVGVDAVATSFGFDTSLETDYVESDEYGRMRFQKFENETYISDQNDRVWYREFAGWLQILMNSGIFDENGNPVDVSNITSVPLSVGSKEDVEAFFLISQIREKGEKVFSSIENGIGNIQYNFSSNLGTGTLVISWFAEEEDETNGDYHISFSGDGELYQISIMPSGRVEGMYDVTYSFRQY